MFLWPDLAAAFPGAPDRRQDTIGDLVTSLRELRNRIGHHHQLLDLPVERRHTELITLARYLDPELERWVRDRTEVPAVLASRPGAEAC
jgi:hypothetical protein